VRGDVRRQRADALEELRRDVLLVHLEAEALLDDRDQLDQRTNGRSAIRSHTRSRNMSQSQVITSRAYRA
jgi:hypothetical protein